MSCPECGCQMYSHRKSDSSNSIRGALRFFQKMKNKKKCEDCKTQIEELEKEVILKDMQIKMLESAIRTAVGFEPFYGLEPRPLSEALEKLEKIRKENR